MTMRRTVYFHIDEIARDAVVAANLRRILNAHDVEVTFGNRANSQLLGLLDNFAAFDLYFFPSIDLFLANCPDVNRLSAPVIILPSETVGGTARNLDRVAAKYFGAFPDECQPWIKKVAAFCVWGPSHLRAFEEKGPELLPKAHVVGHPRFDRRCRPGQPAPGPGKRIRVGLISRFSALNPYDRRGMLQIIYDGRRKMDGRVHPLYRLSPDLNMEDRIFTESMDLRHLFELIDALDPNQYELIVRAHPREDRTRWEGLIRNNKLRVNIAHWDQPFIHWVSGVDYVVGPVSTSFYDCVVAGKRPICTIDIAPHRQNHVLAGGDDENPILNYVLRPGSMDELMQMLAANPKDYRSEIPSGLLDILHKEANYPDCATSLDRIARVCLDVLDASGAKHRSSRAARLKHEAFALGQAIYSLARNHGKPEQSVSFVLSPKRRRWIDNLVD